MMFKCGQRMFIRESEYQEMLMCTKAYSITKWSRFDSRLGNREGKRRVRCLDVLAAEQYRDAALGLVHMLKVVPARMC